MLSSAEQPFADGWVAVVEALDQEAVELLIANPLSEYDLVGGRLIEVLEHAREELSALAPPERLRQEVGGLDRAMGAVLAQLGAIDPHGPRTDQATAYRQALDDWMDQVRPHAQASAMRSGSRRSRPATSSCDRWQRRVTQAVLDPDAPGIGSPTAPCHRRDDDDLAPCTALVDVAQRLGDTVSGNAAIDRRCELAGLEQRRQRRDVVAPERLPPGHQAHPPAGRLRDDRPQEEGLQDSHQPCRRA